MNLGLVELATRRARLQQRASVTNVPVVGMCLQLNQLSIGHSSKVWSSNCVDTLRHDAVNATAVGKVDRVAADVVVVPVENVNTAVWSNLNAESDPGHIVCRHEIVAVLADKT